MYILSDLNGRLIQKSNIAITAEKLEEVVNRFESSLNQDIISTTDESLYNKSNEKEVFDIIIENNMIVDIIPKEKPPEEELPREPAVEDYLIDLDFRMSKIELGLEV